MGLEPTALCLGIGWVAFLAVPDTLRQLPPENGPFGHLTQDVLMPACTASISSAAIVTPSSSASLSRKARAASR